MRKVRCVSSVAILTLWTSLLIGQGQAPRTVAPDNTRTNKTDNAATTADQQKENKADVEMTRQIRELITKDKSLSTYAKNIKIVTQNGNVTLSGPVRSDDEKKAVEAKANHVAGASHVKSAIQIAAKAADKKNP